MLFVAPGFAKNFTISFVVLSSIYQKNYSMKYRHALITDLPVIIAIYNSTIPGRMVTADMEPVSVESKEEWFAQHTANKYPLWIFEGGDDTTIGWASFQPFYGRPAYNATAEISLYLDEAQRGKGYGKKILQCCMKQAPAIGLKNLLGFIFAHNLPSISLFKAMGFEEWGHLINIAVLDNMERSLKILGKRIA